MWPRSTLTLTLTLFGEDLVWHAAPLVYDMEHDMMELRPLNATNWPADLPHSYTQVVAEAPPMPTPAPTPNPEFLVEANRAKAEMLDKVWAPSLTRCRAPNADLHPKVHPTPNKAGAGTCTEGLPSAARQPCCPGCVQTVPFVGRCHHAGHPLRRCRCGG